MRKLFVLIISVVSIITGIGSKYLLEKGTENYEDYVPEIVSVEEESTEKIIDEEIETLQESIQEDVNDSSDVKQEVQVDTKKQEVVNSQSNTKTETKSESKTNSVKTEQKQEEQKKQEEKVETNNQETQKNESSNTKQNNVVSTTFYDSITHGKKEFKSEAEAIARGDKIVDNELNYVLDYNETHSESPIQPTINYYRIYPSVIDENGQYWYYLHFFTTKGEGQDDVLKSKF